MFFSWELVRVRNAQVFQIYFWDNWKVSENTNKFPKIKKNPQNIIKLRNRQPSKKFGKYLEVSNRK